METSLEKPRSSHLTVKLDSSVHTRLKNIATAKKRSPHYLMCEAISAYVEAEEEEQTLLKMVDESIEHFERTGLHTTEEEIDAWIVALKSNPHAPLPVCHT